jgi:hypothetical protein
MDAILKQSSERYRKNALLDLPAFKHAKTVKRTVEMYIRKYKNVGIMLSAPRF